MATRMAARRDAYERLANEVGYDRVDFLWQQVVLDLILEAEKRGAPRPVKAGKRGPKVSDL